MMRDCLLVLGMTVLGVWLAGCESATKANTSSDMKALSKVRGEKINREWKKIYSVEQREKEKVRTHVGFLETRFSEKDPEGKFFVRDKIHDLRGFLLPEGKAFVYEVRGGEVVSSPLGNTGLENGVKRILGVLGGIEFDAVTQPASKTPHS